jgi:hypothetical protein
LVINRSKQVRIFGGRNLIGNGTLSARTALRKLVGVAHEVQQRLTEAHLIGLHRSARAVRGWKLFHSAPTFTNKTKPLATEAPWYLFRAKSLIWEPAAPRVWPDAQLIGPPAPFPPIMRGLADEARAPESTNVNRASLLYTSAAGAGPPLE